MRQKDLKPALKELDFEINEIPKKLYKYTACTEENKKERFKSLGMKKVWLSYAKYLNDPFEGLSLYIDKLKLEAHGYREEYIETIYKTLKSLGDAMLVGSFAASGLTEDMPLWAHYGCDHKGYCLEYDVIDETYIYPVLYKNKRYLANKTLSSFLEDRNEINLTEESIERFLIIWASFMIKHTVWQYEKEYRILRYDEKEYSNNTEGRFFDERELGLELKAIYIGEKSLYKEELLKLGQERTCGVYQMFMNPYEEEFKLRAKRYL